MHSSYTAVPLQASYKEPLPANYNAKTGELNRHNHITVTILLHSSARQAQYDAIELFAHMHQLVVDERNPNKRRMKLSGSIQNMEAAYNVCLDQYENTHTNELFRARSGFIYVPERLQGYIIAIMGLDNRKVAKPQIRLGRTTQTTEPQPTSEAVDAATSGNAVPLKATQIAAAMEFPTDSTGMGQTVGIIELGGGYEQSDLDTYFRTTGTGHPVVTAIGVDGGTNSPDGPNGAQGEVELDIEIVGALAPGASLRVYFAPNTDAGFVNSVLDAIHDGCSVVSISWGGPEDDWTRQAINAFESVLEDAATLNVVVTVASGDNGASDGESGLHVDYPGSSVNAVSCGGTRLILNSATGKIASQTVWNNGDGNGAAGGGVSALFNVPVWQAKANVPKTSSGFAGRGVPDICGPADPESGWIVRIAGQWTAVGGTSCVAPQWAAYFAILKAKGKTLAGIHEQLYTLPPTSLWDVRSGNNQGYGAHKGWDPASGLGSLIGRDAESHLT